MEFIVAAGDALRRRALRASLVASGLESGSEITSVAQLPQLLGERTDIRADAADEGARALALVVTDDAPEQAQFLPAALRAHLPVLIWPLRAGTVPQLSQGAGAARLSAHETARLTSRERQVLALVAAGVANKGIARALGLSPNTVKFHLSASFTKLAVRSRAEAVAAAVRAGEIAL